MKIFVFIARLFVSAMFLFSGFVKLVDPMGSSYKFEEYFCSDVLNLPFLIPYALPFSIILILVEITLGVTLLIGFKRKITTISLLALTTLFLFLTWYSAYYNKVTDCGCFGDALKLTTWETFYKNVVLIALIIFLVFNATKMKPIFSNSILKGITFVFVFVAVIIF